MIEVHVMTTSTCIVTTIRIYHLNSSGEEDLTLSSSFCLETESVCGLFGTSKIVIFFKILLSQNNEIVPQDVKTGCRDLKR